MKVRKSGARVTSLAASVLVTMALLGLAVSRVAASGGGVPPSGVPVNPTFDSTSKAEWSGPFGIEFTQMVTPSSAVSVNDAVRAAQATYTGIVSPQAAPNAQLATARFGLFTETHRCQKAADGSCQLIIDHRQVWVLTYLHANVPYKGPVPPGVDVSKMHFDAQANVVVDGLSGKVLDMFAVGRRTS